MSKYDDLIQSIDDAVSEAEREGREAGAADADDGTYERIVADLRTMLAEREDPTVVEEDKVSPEFLRGVAWVAQLMIDEYWASKEAQERSPLPDLPDTER